jgi:NTP pyrophosphatase (non-canonical NTP hydrolase)
MASTDCPGCLNPVYFAHTNQCNSRTSPAIKPEEHEYVAPFDNDNYLSPRNYSLNKYQRDAHATAIYPARGTGDPGAITYTILGLSGEVGELANKWKKFLRDENTYDNVNGYKADLRAELGDVLWYVANLARELDVNLGDIAADNVHKLRSRAERNQLHGSGDNR